MNAKGLCLILESEMPNKSGIHLIVRALDWMQALSGGHECTGFGTQSRQPRQVICKKRNVNQLLYASIFLKWIVSLFWLVLCTIGF